MLLGPGTPFDYNGKRYTYPDIRLVYWAGGNPFHHHQDLNRLIDGWRRPETVIVHEHFWTAHARHADIVLPAATQMERNDIAASGRDNFLAASHRVFDPPADVRTDYEIFRALAARLGAERRVQRGPRRGRLGPPPLCRGREEGRRPPASRCPISRRSGATAWPRSRRTRPSRCWRSSAPIRSSTSSPRRRAGSSSTPRRSPRSATTIASGHPAWLPPKEWLGAPAAAHYPLHLLSNQPSRKLHSQYDHGSHARGIKIARPRARAAQSRRRRARAASATATSCACSTRAARCWPPPCSTTRVRAGVVQLSTGAWYDPAEPGRIGSLDKHGNPNVLTPDHGTSKLAQAPSANSCLVEIERFDGALPPITCFDPPPFAPPATEPARIDRVCKPRNCQVD